MKKKNPMQMQNKYQKTKNNFQKNVNKNGW